MRRRKQSPISNLQNGKSFFDEILAHSSGVLVQEACDRRVTDQPVGELDDAMSFVLEAQVVYDARAPLDRGDDLLGLADRYARVVGANSISAVGNSVSSALAAVQAEVKRRVASGELAFIDAGPKSILSLAGSFANDPALAELVAEAYAARDAEPKE